MGSPVSVVISEIVMQYTEKQLLEQPPVLPLFWFRYVDDCVTAIPRDTEILMQDHINSINRNIQFTHEKQVNNHIAFLDLDIEIKQDRNLAFGVHRKSTHSGRYLDYDSYHHTTHKRNVILSLKSRAQKICTEGKLNFENKKINQQLKDNGYPRKFISNTKVNSLPNEPPIDLKYISTPYIKGVSEKVGKLLNDYNIKLSNKSSNTLRKHLCKLKDKRDKIKTSQVVYQLDCVDCNTKYTGETGRELEIRIGEHQRNIRNRDQNSMIYRHLDSSGHRDMKWEDVKILCKAREIHTRLFVEASYTLVDRNNVNRSLDVPDQYKSVVREIIK